jgi:hypothetical protein
MLLTKMELCVTGISTRSDFHNKHTTAKNNGLPVS